MKQYKPNYTAKKAGTIIKKILTQTTFAMYNKAIDTMLDSFMEIEDQDLLINTVHAEVRAGYYDIFSDFATEIINFIGNYLSFGVNPSVRDEIRRILEQTANFTADKIKDLLMVILMGVSPENKGDLKTLKELAKEIKNIIFVHVMNRLITIVRYVLFATYASVVETTQKELYVAWMPILHQSFKHPVCKTRRTLFRNIPFTEVQKLYLENEREYKDKQLFEEGYTFLAPHFLCDGMFLARR